MLYYVVISGNVDDSEVSKRGYLFLVISLWGQKFNFEYFYSFFITLIQSFLQIDGFRIRSWKIFLAWSRFWYRDPTCLACFQVLLGIAQAITLLYPCLDCCFFYVVWILNISSFPFSVVMLKILIHSNFFFVIWLDPFIDLPVCYTYRIVLLRSGFEYPSNPSSLSSSMESLAKRSGKRGLKNSIGKIFSSKSKLRSKEANSIPDRSLLNSEHDGQRESERRVKQKLLEDVIHSRTPFSSWSAPTILAWLEVSLLILVIASWFGVCLSVVCFLAGLGLAG